MKLDKKGKLMLIPLFMTVLSFFGCTNFQSAPQPDLTLKNLTPTIKPSVINLNIIVDLDEVFHDIEKSVPRNNNEGKWEELPGPGSGKGILFIWRRDPLNISMNGNSLIIKTTMHYRLRFGHKIGDSWITLGTCGYHGESMRQMEVNLKTSLKFSTDWQIIPETKISIKHLSECKITILEIDITEKLKNALKPKLQAAVNRADEKIENLAGMKLKAQAAWDALNEPILFDKRHDAWLEFRPLSVSVSPINGNGNKASIIFNIRSEPKVILNPKRPSQKKKIAFPDLGIVSNPEKGFHIELRGKLKHDEATKILSNLLVNKQFTFARGRKIKIKQVKVYGSGVTTIIEVDVTGSFDGRIYFTGSPEYDPEKNQLFVNDLDFDVKTKDFLLKTANWLLHGELRKEIMESARWDLSSYIGVVENQIKEIINRRLTDNIRLSGQVYDIKPLAVASIRHSFQVFVQIDGEAELFITDGGSI